MSYKILADALEAKIKAMTRFANADVSQGDDRILNHGKNDCVLIYPGEVSIEDEGQYREDRTWTLDIDLFQRISSDPGTDWGSFIGARDDLISELRKWPNSGQSTIFIKEVGVEVNGKPEFLYDTQKRGPFFIVQRITTTIVENVTMTTGDYA